MIKVQNVKYYTTELEKRENNGIHSRVKVELDMPIDEWNRIKPDIVYPHAIEHNRRLVDSSLVFQT